jgi:predicted RNA-binding protein Jag
VHQALRNHEGIRTESEEIEDSPLKRVVVIAD